MTKREERERVVLAMIASGQKNNIKILICLSRFAYIYRNLKISYSVLQRMVRHLRSNGMIKKIGNYRPHIYDITAKGIEHMRGF